jgi:hypothetical protein
MRHRLESLLWWKALALSTLLLVLGSGSAFASEKIQFDGDFRFRLEHDWSSQRSDGTERDDRARSRVRVRLGIEIAVSDYVDFGARLRTGADLSQQSPHLTILDFNSGDTGKAEFNFDKWYLRARSKSGRISGWAGRQKFPFWKQNDLFWTDDVTVMGLAGTRRQKTGENSELAINVGYFSLPVGMRSFSGQMGAVQIVYSTSFHNVGLTAAAGYYNVDANPSDLDADPLQNSFTDPVNGLDDDILLNGDGLRDYQMLVANVQAKLKVGERPLLFGVDLVSNEENYSEMDPLTSTAANAGETDGYVLSGQYGSTAERGDWLVGYYYAKIESLAVIASYAQNDWVRWGNGPQTRGSNLRGHEFRYAYAASSRLKIVARLYLVESITTIEDGNRFRIDFDYKIGQRP